VVTNTSAIAENAFAALRIDCDPGWTRAPRAKRPVQGSRSTTRKGAHGGVEFLGNPNYCWVVICKNKRFRRHTNLISGHKIPLGETDAVSPAPALVGAFVVRCDDCGAERSYEPEAVLRIELNLPGSFAPHPLFAGN